MSLNIILVFAYLSLCIVSLFILTKSVGWAINYATRMAREFHLSEFIISFFIIAVISVMPEATISFVSAFEGMPEFGLGALLGSNVADLTLVFGIIALFSINGIKVKSEILQNEFLYVFLLTLPIVMGIDGRYSRIEGGILVLSGMFFFATLSQESHLIKKALEGKKGSATVKNMILLAASMAVVLTSAYFSVDFGVKFANELRISPVLISLTIIAVGTCLPELMFGLQAVKTKHDELALGDILGTVITDATIILGLVILIKPFKFNPVITYLTGFAMCVAAFLIAIFMKRSKALTKKEGVILLAFYIGYLVTEILINTAY